MRFSVVQSVSFSVFVALLGSASAGTINLTSGSFDPGPPTSGLSGGPVHFEGDRGFTSDGSVGGNEGSQITGCEFCTPGTTIHLSAAGYPVGEATLDGFSFTSGLQTPEILYFQMLGGEVIAPPFGPSSIATLVVPLEFSGFFDHAIDPAFPFGDRAIETLVANAVATLTLTRVEFPPSSGEFRWRPTDIVYDIVPIVSVVIDLTPNTINAKSHGKISVAILSSQTFDATTIDQQTLRFGKTGQEQSLRSCKKHAKDKSRDGLSDLVCSFETAATGLQAGDTTAVLTGTTSNGTSFSGTESVRVH
jgi:hypothetical protein